MSSVTALFSSPFSDSRIQVSSQVRQWLILTVALISGLAALGLLLHGLLRTTDAPVVVTSTTVTEESIPSSTAVSLVVDVSGAVKKPGLYTLESGSRVGDAVAAAGGITELVAASLVAEEINLAEKIVDGQKIFIPLADSNSVQSHNLVTGENNKIQISISTATQQELESLDGVGEKRAAAIIAGRPYQSLSELVEKKILTASVYAQVEHLLKL